MISAIIDLLNRIVWLVQSHPNGKVQVLQILSNNVNDFLLVFKVAWLYRDLILVVGFEPD